MAAEVEPVAVADHGPRQAADLAGGFEEDGPVAAASELPGRGQTRGAGAENGHRAGPHRAIRVTASNRQSSAGSYGEPLDLGVAGCGRLAEAGYLPALALVPGLRLAAVADPDPARVDAVAGAAAALLGCRPARYASAEELAAAPGLAALLVSTPVSAHEPVAAAAAAAGVTALVEKPFAADRAAALRMAALSPSPRAGFNRRFLQGAALAHRVPAGGWVELELELRYRRAAWRSHGHGDDALLDAGSHLIDLALWLTASPPLAVRAASLDRERAGLVLDLGRGRARISCATDRPTGSGWSSAIAADASLPAARSAPCEPWLTLRAVASTRWCARLRLSWPSSSASCARGGGPARRWPPPPKGRRRRP